MIIQLICAFAAIYGFGVLIGVPRKYLWCAGVEGVVGWGVYLFFEEWQGVLAGAFLCSLVIAVMAHIFARIFKSPVTVFLIPGILTVVPGNGMYQTVYMLLVGNQEASMEYLLQTIEVAGMIALAVFIIDSAIYMLPRKK